MTDPLPRAASPPPAQSMHTGDARIWAERVIVAVVLADPARLREVESLRDRHFAARDLGVIYGAIRAAQHTLARPTDLARSSKAIATHNLLMVRDAMEDSETPVSLAMPVVAALLKPTTVSGSQMGWYAAIISGGLMPGQGSDAAASHTSAADPTAAAVNSADGHLDVPAVPARLRAFEHSVRTSPLTTQVSDAEQRLIAAVINHMGPENRSHMLTQFQPQDFADPLHANTWRAIQRLQSDLPAAPIDAITVAWQSERVADSIGPGIDAATLVGWAERKDRLRERHVTLVGRSAVQRHKQRVDDQPQRPAGSGVHSAFDEPRLHGITPAVPASGRAR